MPGFKHALCIYPHPAESMGNHPGMVFFPPTGLEYIASAFATRIPRVTIADLRHDPAFGPERRLHEFIRREGVDLLGVSVNWGFLFEQALDVVGRLPPEVFTVVGGHEATIQVEEVMRRCPNVDAVARGEAEEIAIELASGRPLGEIAGLSFRRDGSIVHNENRTVGPIKKLPARDRGLRRVSYDFSAYGVNILGGGFDTVLSSRGCPYNCKFCSLNRNPLGKKRGYAERPVESVFEELRSLDADVICFADDNLFVNPKRIERLCDMLMEAGIKKRYIAQARVELARSPALLEKLVRAGFKMLLLGIESANDRSLKMFNKGFTVAQVREYFKVFRRFDIYYHGYFIIGNIGETKREMLAVSRFAHELGLDSISVLRLEARRFTPINDMVQASPDYHVAPDDFVYSDRYSTEYLQRIRRRIRHEFYTPGQVARAARKFIRARSVKLTDLAALPFRLFLAFCNWRRRSRGATIGDSR